MCILGYVTYLQFGWVYAKEVAGWTRFMEWKYPVEVVVRNPALFKGAGMVEAAASL